MGPDPGVVVTAKAGCFLCDAATGRPGPWYDQVLWTDGSCIMIPGIGGLVPGYVLVAPSVHASSLIQAARQDQTIPGSVMAALRHATSVFSLVTYWEHGGPPLPGRSSACVDHAHLHIAPGRIELALPGQKTRYASLGEALLTRSRDRTVDAYQYLLLGWNPGPCSIGADVRVSQYFRRQWAEVRGEPDLWDYALVEDSSTTHQTIRLLRDSGRVEIEAWRSPDDPQSATGSSPTSD